MRLLRKTGIAIFAALVVSAGGLVLADKASPAYADPGPYGPGYTSRCIQWDYQLQWQLRYVPARWRLIGGFWQLLPPTYRWVQVSVPVCVQYAPIFIWPQPYNPMGCYPFFQWGSCYNQFGGMLPTGQYY